MSATKYVFIQNVVWANLFLILSILLFHFALVIIQQYVLICMHNVQNEMLIIVIIVHITYIYISLLHEFVTFFLHIHT